MSHTEKVAAYIKNKKAAFFFLLFRSAHDTTWHHGDTQD